MWCKNCNIETNEEYCPICNSVTIEDVPTGVHWCNHCRVPVQQEVTQADKGICPICRNEMKYMSSDLRPVFPEERLLLEILLGKKPNEWIDKSVWANDSRYFIVGNAATILLLLNAESYNH